MPPFIPTLLSLRKGGKAGYLIRFASIPSPLIKGGKARNEQEGAVAFPPRGGGI
ncbi:MAG: hypothetical protein LBQ59_03980 [Candidatus Peribacteria bacterium]|nr:hypothetical protein [Candidatus Peribacteria bacterium]